MAKVKVRSELRFRIAELFEQNCIDIAAPRREVHVGGALKLLKDE